MVVRASQAPPGGPGSNIALGFKLRSMHELGADHLILSSAFPYQYLASPQTGFDRVKIPLSLEYPSSSCPL